ncbi:MAG: mycothiol synthase [Actinomycetota bacterium]|nr:mycothiol synthase [Actinomycetota bacterium]
MTAEQGAQVQALVEAATAADGVRPFNEAVMLALRYGAADAVRHVAATAQDGEWVGYGHLDLTDRLQGASAEVVVHPDRRRQGIGRALVQRTLQEAAPLTLRLWAHGHHPAAGRLAAALGFTRVRDLWQMRRSLHAELPKVGLPDGVTLRAFRPGVDDDAWLRVNARAFADHPEQGAMTAADLARRTTEPWFDADGFLVAERDGDLVGFHWTKVHAGGEHDPIGEVYVVGVDPDAQGLGLGKALTLAGLWHLRDRGLDQVMLYVESDNAPAIAVYERLGFRHWDTDVMYSR